MSAPSQHTTWSTRESGATKTARRAVFLAVAVLMASVASARAQSVYVLHHEPVDDFFTENCSYSLKTGPEATATAAQSADLKNHAAGVVTLDCFETDIGAPNRAGVIPGQSTITFRLWMKKTASWGVFYPQATLKLKSGTQWIDLCAQPATTTTPIGTTFPNNTAFTLQCQTPTSAITMTTSDRLRLVVSFVISTVSTHTVKVELDFGAASDSKVTAPDPLPPTITSVDPISGPVNWQAVTIHGTLFGSSGTVKFGTTPASTSSWGSDTIIASVPAGLTVGSSYPVTVTVGGAASSCPGNNCSFTVVGPPSITSVVPTAAHRGDSVSITGTNFMTAQPSSTVTFDGVPALTADTTTWSNTTIVTKVPPTASAGPVAVNVAQGSGSSVFTVLLPGTISGTITKAADSTALQGATVQAVLIGAIKATATTAANGTYSLGNLDPGTYDVRVLASGYSSEVRSVTLPNGGASSANVAMSRPGSISGQVTAGGTTPLPGAAVTMFLNSIQQANGNTDASGNFSLSGLHPGSYTLQVVDVGYRTKEQSAVVNDNVNTTADVSLDAAPAGPVQYAYDAIGRLTQVTDPSGDAAIYRYDPVGNIIAIERTGASVVSVSGFSPASGGIGTTVSISGTGFSTTPSQNTVTFGCGQSCSATATVTSATATQLVVTVPSIPSTPVSGAISVTAQGQTANAPGTFNVTAAGGTPTITSFTPILAAAGTAFTVTGTGFDAASANDRLTTNVAAAQVTSASATQLGAIVPITSTGRVSIMTPNGSATSTDYLWVAPAPYATTDVDSTGPIAFGTDTLIEMNTPNKIAMRAFDSTQGHRAAVSLTVGTGFESGGSLAIYGSYANPTSIGFAGTGFLEPVDLRVTGTYTFILAPNSPRTGNATVKMYDVPADQTGPIALGGSVPVSLAVGQNARLTFTGAATSRVCAATTLAAQQEDLITSAAVKLLTPDGWQVASTTFNWASPAFLDVTTLPSSGTYTLVIDPDTTSKGLTTAFLYSVPQDFSGTLTLNGSPVPVSLSTCQNAALTFSGAAAGSVTVHVTGNDFGGGTVAVKLFDADTGAQLSSFTDSSGSFDLAPGSSATGHYRITVDPWNTAQGTLSISVSGS